MSQDIRDVRQRVTQELHQPEPKPSEASMLERLSDPNLQQADPAKQTATTKTASGSGGIQWVRVSDVLNGRGTRLADLHANGQENLVRKMRHGMSQVATSRRGTARQAAQLPPLSSFGQAPATVSSQAVGA